MVAALGAVQGCVGSALDDAACLDDQDLVRSANRRQTMGDDKRCAVLHEIAEAALDESLGLGIEGAGGLVEDEDAGVGENGARDGNALPLSSGELDAALADNGVVLVGEPLGELVDARDAAGLHEQGFAGMWTAEEDVLADGAVEEKRFLEDDAELSAKAAEADCAEVHSIDTNLSTDGSMEAAQEGDDGRLAGARRADQRGDGAVPGLKADAVEDGRAGNVGEGDVCESNLALDGCDGPGAFGFSVLFGFAEYLREPEEDREPERSRTVASIQGEVAFANVTFAYVPGTPVLHGISFQAGHGTVTALVGSSGSGKSTIISLLCGFHAPIGGQVCIDGVDLSTIRLSSFRRQLGVVLQETFLFDGTIRENVLFSRPHATEAQLMDACRIARVDEFAERFPDQYDTVVGERGIKLSGGQRQRISIARAILADPSILILDEATSSLDSESEALIQSGLSYLMQNRTTFVIAHRLSTIRRADQILVVEGAVSYTHL